VRAFRHVSPCEGHCKQQAVASQASGVRQKGTYAMSTNAVALNLFSEPEGKIQVRQARVGIIDLGYVGVPLVIKKQGVTEDGRIGQGPDRPVVLCSS
jgi:hypothetical protein